MNKSYSKIRHIQESNQRLENRLLTEQTTPQTTTVPSRPPQTTTVVTRTTTKTPPSAGFCSTDNNSGMVNKKGTWSGDENTISLFNEKNQVVFVVRLNVGATPSTSSAGATEA